MAMQITAYEINRESNRLIQQMNYFKTYRDNLVKNLKEVEGKVDSADSELSTTINEICSIYDQIWVLVDGCYTDLHDEMEEWCKNTIQNEEEQAGKNKQIGANLEAIKSALNTINFNE